MKIVQSKFLAETPPRNDLVQVKFPRSHRKRIRKKWAKKENFVTVTIPGLPEQGPYVFDGQLVCGPVAFDKLQEGLGKITETALDIQGAAFNFAQTRQPIFDLTRKLPFVEFEKPRRLEPTFYPPFSCKITF